MISACGVLCSECPAFIARAESAEYKRTLADAWQRIYGLSVDPQTLHCGGCLGPDDQLFYMSCQCKARRCCVDHTFATCAQCSREFCPELSEAQSLWDDVPALAMTLSAADFETYARPYCGHRERIAAARTQHPGMTQ